MNPADLTIHTPMGEIMDTLPGARRALFSAYHLGGCQSCGFSPNETLAELAARAAEVPPGDMLAHILQAHEHDQAMLVSPVEAKALLDTTPRPILLDTRTREEHEAVAIPGSEFMTQDLQQKLFAGDPETRILLYDHTGRHVLDHCSWFHGHGLRQTRAIDGGIDAWSRTVDPTLRRYKLEIDS